MVCLFSLINYLVLDDFSHRALKIAVEALDLVQLFRVDADVRVEVGADGAELLDVLGTLRGEAVQLVLSDRQFFLCNNAIVALNGKPIKYMLETL